MGIDWLENKEFVLTIDWIIDANTLVSEGTEEVLDHLRETGSADLINIRLRDKEGSK